MDNPDTKPMPPSPCPFCGFMSVEAEVGPGQCIDRGPLPDDYALCPRCLAFSVFCADMRLRPPTREEMVRLIMEMLHGTENGKHLLEGLAEAAKRIQEKLRRDRLKVLNN